MPKGKTTIVGVSGDTKRSVAWVSIGDTGDVSAGLTDRRIVLASPGGKRNGSRNPHFTFHAPIYHHLHTEGEPELVAGLMEIGMMLRHTTIVPWVRLVSRPYKQLPSFHHERGTSVLEFHADNPDASAQVELDFADTRSFINSPQFMYAHVTPEIMLRLAVQSCPPTLASLTLLWPG